jgi:hypothetical protein
MRTHYRVYIGNYNMEAMDNIQGEYLVGVVSSGTNKIIELRTPHQNITSFVWNGTSIVATLNTSSYYMMLAQPVFYEL